METTNTISTYVTKASAVESAGRTIGFDNQLLIDLIIQGINTVILIVAAVILILIVVLIIRLCLLSIKALKIYINKNS